MLHNVRGWAMLVAVGWVYSGSAASQPDSFPARPIKLVVPFPERGGIGPFFTAFAEKLQARIGKQVSAEFEPGRHGLAASELAANSKPDGHTLLVTTTYNYAVVPAAAHDVAYDLTKNFRPIALVMEVPYLVLVPPHAQTTSVDDLVRLAKETPMGVRCAYGPHGTMPHAATEYFVQQLHLKSTGLAYRVGLSEYKALAEGNVDFVLSTFGLAQYYIKKGQAKPIAVSRKDARVPELPSLEEKYPGLDLVYWYGILAAKGAPTSVVAKTNAVVKEVLADSEVSEKINSLFGGTASASATPEDFEKLLASEATKWRRVVEETGMDLPK